MRVKKFLNKLRCTKYNLWIMKDYSTLYDGPLNDFKNTHQYQSICESKIEWFSFVKTNGENQISIYLKKCNNANN